MFSIEQDAQEYIRSKSGAVIISFTFEPSMGGCPCSGKNVTGSYVPKVTEGIPQAEDKEKYQVALIENIRIFYPENLTVKVGFPAIRIILKSLVLFKWLELEGAQAVSFETRSEAMS